MLLLGHDHISNAGSAACARAAENEKRMGDSDQSNGARNRPAGTGHQPGPAASLEGEGPRSRAGPACHLQGGASVAATAPGRHAAERRRDRGRRHWTRRSRSRNALKHSRSSEPLLPACSRITPDNAEAILDFYNSYLPLVREEARGAHQRTLLARLRKAAPDLAERTSKLIAGLDLADGLADRAQRLRGDPSLGDELSRQTAAFEQAYGANVITEMWGTPSHGPSLLHYLEHHPDLVAGKDVLHVAPENELRSWLRSLARRYVILDGMPEEGTNVGADITAIPLPDASFDFILCHRVLEHVLDDIGAMRELHRILRPGGVLNASVPRAVHREHTAEWLVPDESRDWRVRQYGQDLKQRLEDVGFEVRLIDWLCKRPREEMLSISAFPMRLYEAIKTI
jgi:SAM-dependent methyltransferase